MICCCVVVFLLCSVFIIEILFFKYGHIQFCFQIPCFLHRKHKRMRTQFSSKIKTNFDFCHTGNTVIPLKKPILHKEERKEICIFFFFNNGLISNTQIFALRSCSAFLTNSGVLREGNLLTPSECIYPFKSIKHSLFKLLKSH